MLTAIALLAFTACGPDKEKIVNEKVTERVTAFRSKKIWECNETLLDKAEKIVDSLLLAEAEKELNDSLIRLKPPKPLQPPPLLPIDTLQVSPLFFAPASSTRQGE